MSKQTAELDAAYSELTGKDANIAWLRHARACSVGPFVVYGPAGGGSKNLYVTLADNPVASISPDGFMLFEGTGRLVTSLFDRDGDGRFDWLDYQGRDKQTGESIWAYDMDFDGRTDMLTFNDPDGTPRRLMQIEGTWLERVKRDGELWFEVDGKFVRTREEAGALLRARHDNH